MKKQEGARNGAPTQPFGENAVAWALAQVITSETLAASL